MNREKEIKELSLKENFLGKVSRFFVERFQIALLAILLIVFVGISGILTLPKESLPEIVFPSVVIQTAFPGAGPQDVERLVTDVIEAKMSSMDDLDTYTSESQFGSSIVRLSFVSGVDIEDKKTKVSSALDELSFTDGVLKPQVQVFSTSDIPLLSIGLSGPYSIESLTQMAEEVAIDLEKIKGISESDLLGGLDREIQIIVDQKKMIGLGINQEDISRALMDLNSGQPINDLNLNGAVYALRIDETPKTIEDVENTIIQVNESDQLYLRDIAKIVDGSSSVESFNRTYESDKGAYPSVTINLKRLAQSDVIGTSNQVKERLERLKSSTLPQDINILISSDLAENVEADLDNIQDSAISGLIVVILVLFLFIGFKESLIVSITIPLTLLFTLGVLEVFGITLNTFAVLGLIVALGLLVDNSIIVMENMDRLSNKGLNGKSAALVGFNQVAFPILASTLTTLAAFFPLAILPGTLGDFVETIPRTIMIALTASLIVSVIITPSIYARLSNVRERKLGSFFEKIMIVPFSALAYYAFGGGWISNIATIVFALWFMKKYYWKKSRLNFIETYSKVLKVLVSKKAIGGAVLIMGFLVLVGTFGMIASGRVEIAFFPENTPTRALIKVDTPGGTTLTDTYDIVSQIESKLIELEGIESYNVTVGGIERDYGEIVIDLDTEVSGTIDKIEDLVNKIPGALILVERESSGGPPIGKPVELVLEGTDLDNLKEASESIVDALNAVNGVYNIASTLGDGAKEILMDIDEKSLSSLGLSVASINNQLESILDGSDVMDLKIDGESVPLRIEYNLEQVESIDQLSSLYLVNNRGEMIPILSAITFVEKQGLSGIGHEDGQRVVSVTADLREYTSIGQFKESFDSVLADWNIEDVSVAYGGDVEGIESNFLNLFKSMGLAVFLVFIILTLQFNSIKQPFIILSTVPMALIGVIFGLYVTGNDFGFYAFMGLVALVGIAVNDAIVLIDYMNYLRKQGMDITDAIIEAGKTRFNPVLATTLTTIGGVLPLAFKEVYYAQFGFTLVFGLLITTVLTLVYIPIMYSLIIKKGKEDEKFNIGFDDTDSNILVDSVYRSRGC